MEEPSENTEEDNVECNEFCFTASSQQPRRKRRTPVPSRSQQANAEAHTPNKAQQPRKTAVSAPTNPSGAIAQSIGTSTSNAYFSSVKRIQTAVTPFSLLLGLELLQYLS